ncbi:unnamed protein product [Blepharisma stoltei]|uniref:DDE-1 domain-containing protein n=1 Tax=Blepharisma stoltei TaxID=1481888 RepID=A0AAU9JUC5_9CILI|nr:unnamed protein product [Blepharisma stoltei]
MNHFITVMLMIRADGEKMPALLIFQEKNGQIPNLVRERLNIPENVIIKSNKSGYISDQILNDYLRTILRRENQLLIYDQAGSHKTIMISNAISDLDATKIVIPGGCTKYLQPLDALVIANFKSKTTDFRIKIPNRADWKKIEKNWKPQSSWSPATDKHCFKGVRCCKPSTCQKIIWVDGFLWR